MNLRSDNFIICQPTRFPVRGIFLSTNKSWVFQFYWALGFLFLVGLACKWFSIPPEHFIAFRAAPSDLHVIGTYLIYKFCEGLPVVLCSCQHLPFAIQARSGAGDEILSPAATGTPSPPPLDGDGIDRCCCYCGGGCYWHPLWKLKEGIDRKNEWKRRRMDLLMKLNAD